MELANIPLRYVTSLDKDLNLYAGIARRGVVQGSWIERENGNITVGEVTVAVQGERADAHFLGWGANDFTGHVTLNFDDLPLTLKSLTATGHQPDLTFQMNRKDRKDPWNLQLISPSLTTAIQHAQLPMYVPPLRGGPLELRGVLADDYGKNWQAIVQGMTLAPVFANVDVVLGADWQLNDEINLLSLRGNGTAKNGSYSLEGVTISPTDTLHLGYQLPIFLDASVGHPTLTNWQKQLSQSRTMDEITALSGAGFYYDWNKNIGSMDIVAAPVDAAWAMEHLQPWLGDAVAGLAFRRYGSGGGRLRSAGRGAAAFGCRFGDAAPSSFLGNY